MTYTLAKGTPNMLQILTRQESLLVPLVHTSPVRLDIMQWEYREHILPFTVFRGNASTAFFLGDGDHMVYHTQAFGFGLGFDGISGFGFRVADAIKPIAYSVVEIQFSNYHK